MNITNIVNLALFVIFKSLASLNPIPNIDELEIVIVSKKFAVVSPLGYLWNVHRQNDVPSERARMLSHVSKWKGKMNVDQENSSTCSSRNGVWKFQSYLQPVSLICFTVVARFLFLKSYYTLNNPKVLQNYKLSML